MYDPELNQYVEETRAFNQVLREQVVMDISTPEKVAAARQPMQDGGPFASVVLDDVAVQRSVPGPGGDIPVRVFSPPDVRAVYLHLHGGGWAVGRPEMNDVSNWDIAQGAEVAVVSVDYRLAPEHPYPAGPDDCEAVALWLLEHARAEFGSERLLIGGESAGAHLSALTLLRMRDRHGAQERFAAANLVFGAYDLSLSPSVRHAGDSLPVLTSRGIDDFVGYFLPGRSVEERRAPEFSPLYADLSGMPPALFTVGTADALLDDSLFMAARWSAAGGSSELAVYPEAAHGFTGFPMQMARVANERCLRFIARGAAGD